MVVSVFFMDSALQNYQFMTWNVRGLNNPAKQEEVKQVISIVRPDIVCLQETKLSVVDNIMIVNCLGQEYEGNFCYMPADGTRGGILLAAKNSLITLQQIQITVNTISAQVVDLRNNETWSITGVYGPQGDLEKKMLIRELRQLKSVVPSKWLLLGDFNLVYQDQDKNNGRLDRRMMNRFRRALNHLEVKEISLIGRKFTWSNQQRSPTLTRIDRVFCSTEWEGLYADPILQTLSSSASDHCPLLLASLNAPRPPARFRFEMFWVHMPGFQEIVQEAWQRPILNRHNPLSTLHIKLSRTSKALKAWSRTLIPQGKLAMAICREVIGRLECAQEERQLSQQEIELLKMLKLRILGLAAIEKSRARQRSRITWLKKGDANTKFFQLMANRRKAKNFIHSLQTGHEIVTSQHDKHQAIFEHFKEHIGTHKPRTCTLDFDRLEWEPRNLEHLELPFTMTELQNVIKTAPKEKSPGPDGFIGMFFAHCWDIIKMI